MSFDAELGKVQIAGKNEKYGDLKNTSAHGLYKKYKAWVSINKPQEKPLSFKKWIGWAKETGLVKNYSADGDEKNNNDAITYPGSLTKAQKENVENVKSTGKTIAKIFIGVSMVVISLSFVKWGKPEGSEGSGDSLNVA